jgi:hypothetical protein
LWFSTSLCLARPWWFRKEPTCFQIRARIHLVWFYYLWNHDWWQFEFFIFSFSDVFYIDATDEQTIQTDLEAITPEHTERSADASLRWFASQREGNWLLFFDNADDVKLKLKEFFPACVSGNILVTTRNRELRIYSAKDGDANVTGMDHEDATNLLLHLARAEESDENKALAEAIVQVLSFIFIYLESFQTKTRHRNSITLPWLSPKLALTFIATRH